MFSVLNRKHMTSLPALYNYQHLGLVLGIMLLLVGCTVPPDLGTPTPTTMPQNHATIAAEQALQDWIDALKSGDCEQVLSGLARSVDYWNPDAIPADVCQTFDATSWTGMEIVSVVAANEHRVIFRVRFPASMASAQTHGYVVMIHENGKWRYAGDILRALEIRPKPALTEGLEITVGPVWERVDALTLVVSIHNQGKDAIAWATPCAWLRWSDGREIEALTCPADTIAPGASWSGSLSFAKSVPGEEIDDLPQVLHLGFTSPAGQMTVQYTLRWLQP